MGIIKISSKTAFIFSLISFVVAALSITGTILKTDLTGRSVWALIWALIGIGWLAGIIRSRDSK